MLSRLCLLGVYVWKHKGSTVPFPQSIFQQVHCTVILHPNAICWCTCTTVFSHRSVVQQPASRKQLLMIIQIDSVVYIFYRDYLLPCIWILSACGCFLLTGHLLHLVLIGYCCWTLTIFPCSLSSMVIKKSGVSLCYNTYTYRHGCQKMDYKDLLSERDFE